MRLDNFDLNLLVVFDALLEERSVTRAAKRLNVTQSAMSASLKRLREAFQDEILVQHGIRMVPTNRALELASSVSTMIMELRSLISSGRGFDAATSQRRFRIEASDYITTVLLVPLIEKLQTVAPNITLDLSLPGDGTFERLANGDIDLILVPEEFALKDHPCEVLFEERHVVIGWSENPLMQRPLSKRDFFESGHVAVRISNRDTFIETALRNHDAKRRIEITAPSFIQAPWLVAGTGRLGIMHERLARLMAPLLSLSIAEIPFEVPVMREVMQYHSARESDAALVWLRNCLRDSAASSPAGPTC